ncbi:MAG: hypothetical protein ABL962_05520 [Fimbriimonadaceae bacterium]
MRRPTSIPPGKAGLVVLAFALAPVLISVAKPAIRAVGRGFRKFGEATERKSGGPEPAATKAEEPVAEVKEEAADAKPKAAKKKKSPKD